GRRRGAQRLQRRPAVPRGARRGHGDSSTNRRGGDAQAGDLPSPPRHNRRENYTSATTVRAVEAVTVSTNDAQHIRGFVGCEPLLASFDRIVVVDNACTDESPAVARDAGCDVVRCE